VDRRVAPSCGAGREGRHAGRSLQSGGGGLAGNSVARGLPARRGMPTLGTECLPVKSHDADSSHRDPPAAL